MEIRRFLLVFLLICASFSSITAQSSKPIVSGIKAVQSSSETTVTWIIPEDSSDVIASLYVYRSSEAILAPARLTGMAPVAVLPPDAAIWQEKAETARYYYAVIARLSDGSLYDILIPSVNTTLYAATMPQMEMEKEEASLSEIQITEPSAVGGIRQKPLPSFRIFDTVSEKTMPITAETLSAAADLGAEGNRETATSLYIAEEDIPDTSTGDTYLLHDIVSRYMLRKNWNRAKEELIALTQTYHSEEITARINLYLGQCSYFLEDYLVALQYFLNSETLYPDITRIWIQTTINAFVLPDLSK